MTFQKALQLVTQLVGGWDVRFDWPIDLGGPQKAGISQAAYDHFCQYRGIPSKPVFNLTSTELTAVYLEMFWSGPKIGNSTILAETLGEPADFVYFQLGASVGTQLAFGLLQLALNVPATNLFDPATQASFLIATQTPKALATSLLAHQLYYYTFEVSDTPYRQACLTRVERVRDLI